MPWESVVWRAYENGRLSKIETVPDAKHEMEIIDRIQDGKYCWDVYFNNIYDKSQIFG